MRRWIGSAVGAVLLWMPFGATASNLDASELVGIWIGPELGDQADSRSRDAVGCAGVVWEFRDDNLVIVDKHASFHYSWSVGTWFLTDSGEGGSPGIELRLFHLSPNSDGESSVMTFENLRLSDSRLGFSVIGRTYRRGVAGVLLKSLGQSNWLCRAG